MENNVFHIFCLPIVVLEGCFAKDRVQKCDGVTGHQLLISFAFRLFRDGPRAKLYLNNLPSLLLHACFAKDPLEKTCSTKDCGQKETLESRFGFPIAACPPVVL